MVPSPNARGFVLPLVAILLLALTLLFTTLLKSAGKMNPVMLRYKSDFEAFYRAESAVLLHLQGFPSGYYPELPKVQAEPFGPWEKICTVSATDSLGESKSDEEFCFIAGTEPHNVSYWDWTNGLSNYRSALEKRVLEETSEKALYGNRRYFQGEPSMSGAVHQGDLEIDFADTVRRAEFWVEGTTLIRGQAHFDTLRLYAMGDVVFQGKVSVDYLELFTRGSFRAEDDVHFRGVVLASSYKLQGRAQGAFPSVVVSLGYMALDMGFLRGEILEHASVTGTAEVLGGFLGLEDSSSVQRTMLPAFVEGRRKIWGRL